jgi:hypothetical protein
VTRVLVTRHPSHHHRDHDANTDPSHHHPDHDADSDPSHHPNSGPIAGPGHRLDTGSGANQSPAALLPSEGEPPEAGLEGRLRAAMALLPPILGGPPTQPLEVGRTTRIIQPAQRSALTVRDGGCVFPGCPRPLAWCEAHHLRHWLHGGPTNLTNLALLCWAHHRAVHEGGWQLARQPDGRLTATPPHRTHPPHRRHPTAA